MSKLKVASKKCSQCLYDKNRIVPDSRAKQIIRDCARHDSHFECHKGTLYGEKIVCAGSHQSRNPGQLVRIMERLGAIELVDPDAFAAEQKAKGRAYSYANDQDDEE